MHLSEAKIGSISKQIIKPIKIDLHFDGRRANQIAVYQRVEREFLLRNIKCRFLPDSIPDPNSLADLFVLQQKLAKVNLEDLRRPVILEEKEDSSMPIARKAIRASNVIGCFKVAVVKQEWINLPVRRAHAWILDHVEDRPEQIILSDEQIAKIRPGFSFAMFDRMQPWITRAENNRTNDLWRNRPIDVLFAGCTSYATNTLTEHRRTFCNELKSLSGLKVICETSRIMSLHEYFLLSPLAKVIVSPWGYGELCYRDFEALLDGSILVKPRTDFIHTIGNFLRDGETYLACEPDASDLASVINLALTGKIIGVDQRIANRKELLRWWEPSRLVTWWLNQFNIKNLI